MTIVRRRSWPATFMMLVQMTASRRATHLVPRHLTLLFGPIFLSLQQSLHPTSANYLQLLRLSCELTPAPHTKGRVLAFFSSSRLGRLFCPCSSTGLVLASISFFVVLFRLSFLSFSVFTFLLDLSHAYSVYDWGFGALPFFATLCLASAVVPLPSCRDETAAACAVV